MAVEDTPVHESGKRSIGHHPGCYNRTGFSRSYWVKDGLVLDHSAGTTGRYLMKGIPHTASTKCRQILDLPECEGCSTEKDHEYINRMKELSK